MFRYVAPVHPNMYEERAIVAPGTMVSQNPKRVPYNTVGNSNSTIRGQTNTPSLQKFYNSKCVGYGHLKSAHAGNIELKPYEHDRHVHTF